MSTPETTLTSLKGYNPTNMVFSEPQSGAVPNSTPKIEFQRINIQTRNPDGTVGELIVPTERVFSYGVSENVNQDTGKVTGYTFPLCLYTRDNPTPNEIEWVEGFENIVEHCIDHLVENREEIGQYELQRSDLTKSKGGLNPIYWKRERVKDEASGKMVWKKVDGCGPTLYTKLIWSKKNNKSLTYFSSTSDEPIDSHDLMSKYCYANAAVKIESIFISGTGKISLQIKLYEAVVEPSQTGMKRLLARPKADTAVKMNNTSTAALQSDDEEGSLVGSDDEKTIEVAETPVVKKKATRRVVKKAA